MFPKVNGAAKAMAQGQATIKTEVKTLRAKLGSNINQKSGRGGNTQNCDSESFANAIGKGLELTCFVFGKHRVAPQLR